MSDLSVGCRVRVTGRRAEQNWLGTVVDVEQTTAEHYSVCIEFNPKLKAWLPSYDLEVADV